MHFFLGKAKNRKVKRVDSFARRIKTIPNCRASYRQNVQRHYAGKASADTRRRRPPSFPLRRRPLVVIFSSRMASVLSSRITAGAAAFAFSTIAGGGGALLLGATAYHITGVERIVQVVHLTNFIGRPTRMLLFWKRLPKLPCIPQRKTSRGTMR